MKIGKCLQCGCDFPVRTRDKIVKAKYCSQECQLTYQRNQKERKFLEGGFVGRLMSFPTNSWPRNLLIRIFGYHCNICKISEWNGVKLTLEVNHKDGDAENNSISNLEFLCPNCHSLTSNFRNLKGSNRQSKRAYRLR